MEDDFCSVCGDKVDIEIRNNLYKNSKTYHIRPCKVCLGNSGNESYKAGLQVGLGLRGGKDGEENGLER